MATIRDYDVTVSDITASILVNDTSKTSYAALPTLAEIQRVTGQPVEEINLSYCFQQCDSLTTAPAIPNGVTSMIGCFDGCTLLTTAPTIPNSVTSMYGCFYDCASLTTAPTIPSGVTSMNSCFYNCGSLTTAPTIPSGVTSMNSCFYNCESLTTAPTIPSGVTSMVYCFDGCTSLTTAPTIPNSVTRMDGCFSGCASLTTAPAIPSGVIDMFDCFAGCESLTTAPAIPSSVTDISGCFARCLALATAPTIPSSVTKMRLCFAHCTSLTTAPTIPSSVTDINSCFEDCTALTTAPTIPSGVTDMYQCFNGCTALTGKITINANPSTYTGCMQNTQQDIVLVGSSALLQNIADTATNNNVYVWSLSINLSAERQEDDVSKANVSVIINRFRNNNESVSLTFTMNGVEGTPVQVTMDTATKTYTGVLSITPSSIVELSVIAEDSYGKSAPKSITIPIPFYTIDFKAGGKEVAVGAPANDDTSNRPYGLFKCGMDLVVTRLVGEIKMWAGDTVPYGWLLCDGSEVSKTEYPYLYSSIGDLWGTPNSSSNFKLPNLAGRVPVGYNSADTDFATVGHTDGEKTHTLSVAEMPSHTHKPRTNGDRLLEYNYSTTGQGVGERKVAAATSGSQIAPVVNSSKTEWIGVDYIGSTGDGAPHNNLQPYAVVKYIICAF